MQAGGAAGKGVVSLGSRIIRQEGVIGLYKGLLPPLISLSVLNTIIFPSYSIFREKYNACHGWDVRNALAGMSAGPMASTISTVEGVVKTQMQLDNVNARRNGTKVKYKNSIHCITSLVRESGISVMYHGLMVNLTREFVFLGSYFFMYEGLKEELSSSCTLDAKISVPLAGGFSGAISWFVSFPLDCIRAGVQGQTCIGSKNAKKGIAVALQLWNEKGLTGLYSGVTPSIARAFLVSGSRFSAYESATWLLRRLSEGDK